MTAVAASPIAPPLAGARPRASARHLAIFLFALFVGCLSITPFWIAQARTPIGWHFTGVLYGNPDEMQYRMLLGRSLLLGPIVDNPLTTQPNAPHIVLVFYWAIGAVARLCGVPPPFVYAYLGAFVAFAFTLLVFFTARHFLGSERRAWWVTPIVLFGGGLGAHLLILNSFDHLRHIKMFHQIVGEGLNDGTVLEAYRHRLLLRELFDTHFLFFNALGLVAMLAFYRAVKRSDLLSASLAVFMFGAVTVLHIYDGITLLAAGWGAAFVLWLRGLPTRRLLIVLAGCAVVVVLAVGWQLELYSRTGMPTPTYRERGVLFSAMLLGFPIQWGLIAWGLSRYWSKAGVDECFLLGWALGCVAICFSEPFYPYADRGMLTLQVPLTIVAAAIYFAHWQKVSVRHALIALAILGAGPVWLANEQRVALSFGHSRAGPPPPYRWQSPDNQAIVAALRQRSVFRDVLIVDKRVPAARSDDLWLTFGYNGRLYAGHYGLTPDYDTREQQVNAFFADPPAHVDFLRSANIRFVFVRGGVNLAPFQQVKDLHPVITNSAGTLFEYRPPQAAELPRLSVGGRQSGSRLSSRVWQSAAMSVG